MPLNRYSNLNPETMETLSIIKTILNGWQRSTDPRISMRLGIKAEEVSRFKYNSEEYSGKVKNSLAELVKKEYGYFEKNNKFFLHKKFLGEK